MNNGQGFQITSFFQPKKTFFLAKKKFFPKKSDSIGGLEGWLVDWMAG